MVEFMAFVRQSTEELKTSNNKLAAISTKQDELIELHSKQLTELQVSNQRLRTDLDSLSAQVDHNKSTLSSVEELNKLYGERILSLECELDDVRQKQLMTEIILSGPAITDFISNCPEKGSNIKSLGPETLGKLKILLAAKTLRRQPVEPEEAPRDVTEDTEVGAGNVPATVPNDSNHHALRRSKSYGILSAILITDTRILVTLTSRESARTLFSHSKLAGDTWYAAEQLTRTRQNVMFELRKFRRAHPTLSLTIFSRNGCPSVRIGEDTRIHQIRNETELKNFIAVQLETSEHFRNDG